MKEKRGKKKTSRKASGNIDLDESRRSFLAGVNTPLGMMADACLDAFEFTGDERLKEAANALRAIECVDLTGCADGYPLPWEVPASAVKMGASCTSPIMAGMTKEGFCDAVIYRQDEDFPPDIGTCEAIVRSMNTVFQLQTAGGVKGSN